MLPQAPTQLSRVLPLKVTHRNISIPKLSNVIEQQLSRNHTLRSVRVKMPNLVRLYRPFCATRLAFRRGGSRAARQKLTTLRAEHSARAGRVPRVQEHLRSQVRPNLIAAVTARFLSQGWAARSPNGTSSKLTKGCRYHYRPHVAGFTASQAFKL